MHTANAYLDHACGASEWRLSDWCLSVQALLVAFNALVLVFAARKYTQPVKDDIGDKSVFQFQALPADEQERRLAAMRARSGPDEDPF